MTFLLNNFLNCFICDVHWIKIMSKTIILFIAFLEFSSQSLFLVHEIPAFVSLIWRYQESYIWANPSWPLLPPSGFPPQSVMFLCLTKQKSGILQSDVQVMISSREGVSMAINQSLSPPYHPSIIVQRMEITVGDFYLLNFIPESSLPRSCHVAQRAIGAGIQQQSCHLLH